MIRRKKQAPPKRYDVHRTLSSTAPLATDGTAAVSVPTKDTAAKAKKRRFTWKKALLLLFIILLTPLLVIGIWDARNVSHASDKMFGSGNLVSLLAGGPLQSTEGRVNILLIGYSIDDPGHGGAALTDSIMILSLRPDNKTGYMLSIPRDLYVDIPTYGSAKINEAYQAGGTPLLEQTIKNSFGIDLQYSVIINYAAVKQIVDALNGITVTIKSTDPRGVYDPNFRPQEGGPLKLANGPQALDGQTALNLTRARGATFGSYGLELSDFTRTEHQRQVLTAIKEKLKWELVLDPRKNSPIFEAAADNIKTDVHADEALPLFRLFNSIPNSSLVSVNLRDFNKVNLLASYRTPLGQSALIPAAGIDDFSQIQAALKTLNQ
jgi:LCP family protein required for cell wall assembly